MSKLLKIFWVVSVFFFLAALLYAYGILPELVKIFETAEDRLTFTKANFFYLALIILFFTNILLYGMRFVLNGYLQRGANVGGFVLWITGLSGVLNIFYGLCVIALSSINSDLDAPVGILFYGGVLLILLWLILPALAFFKRSA